MTKHHIEEIQDKIEALLAEQIDPAYPVQVSDHLVKITAYLGNSAKCIAEATRLQMQTKAKWVRQHEERLKDMKPTVAKEFANSSCIDEQILVLRCTENARMLSKAGENLRSVLSMMKEEMKLTGG